MLYLAVLYNLVPYIKLSLSNSLLAKVFRLREGVGIATCNIAEYQAMILGLKYALKEGFKQICVQGDSQLVCMQVYCFTPML